MRIRYENTVEDLVAFTRYHSAHSPTVQRAIWRSKYYVAVPALVLLALGGLGGGAERDPVGFGLCVVIVVAIVVAYVVLTPSVWRWWTARQARRLYAEGTNKGVLGPHELELIGDELVERSPFSESRCRLQLVERVVTESGYTFIYLSAISAYVVPHTAVTEGDLAAFLEALKQRKSVDT